MKKGRFLEIIVFLLVLLFTYAALSKLKDYENFQVQLGKSPLLTAFAYWVAWAAPTLELVVALSLCIPKTRLLGMYASFMLMTFFTGYIIVILNFSDYIPCSCGGVLQNMTWQTHLLFNIAFTLIALLGILLQSDRPSTEQVDRQLAIT